MSSNRKCKNWLVDFGRWTLPRCESPETFVFWAGLFTLASAIRRRVFVSKKYLGGWDVYPSMYVIFVGPAGGPRKSTTMDFSRHLLQEVAPTLTRAPDLITKEMLLTSLSKSEDGSMYIHSREFGEFIVKSGPEMFGFLTNAYDGIKDLAVGTLSRGHEFVDKPCINLLAGTTPEWIAENMPESVIGGGFASRTILIYEETVRRREIFYDDLNWEEIDKIGARLLSDLTHIANNITGEFTLTPEAHEFFRSWYKGPAQNNAGATNHKLRGYFERKPAHALKVAILVHIAHSDNLVLEIEDFQEALVLLEQIEHKLPVIFQSIGRNPYTVDIYRMLDYIVENGPVSKQDVRRKFLHAATPVMLEELMTSLLEAGFVEGKVDGADLMLRASSRLEVV